MNTHPEPAAGRLAPGIRTIVAVWLVLIAITIILWCLTPDHHDTGNLSDEILVTAIVALGMVKSRLIIRYFMEVRSAPRWLQIATDAWIVALWLTLLAVPLYR
ncbi:cytochrome C oxidase subunit IV family protein [Nocardia sp. NPDC052278]|uniref:cytochrome C oxidase subunit IV family protein n=1 Tax=unclassified Nocardia TaxID=2637762 RepID=UPI0036AB16C5